MKTKKRVNLSLRRSLLGLAAFTWLSLGLAPAYASDTELYTGASTATFGASAPTLMFMLDNSGSMGACIANADGTTRDEYGCSSADPTKPLPSGTPQRIIALQRSMYMILNGDISEAVQPIPGYVRVGLTNYRSDSNGGYVTYPARPLDAFVDISPTGVINSSTSASADDAEQPVSGGLTTTSTTLDLAYDSGSASPQYVGMRFPKLMVPKGATITSASLEFTANNNDSGIAPLWQIDVEASDDAQPFTSADLASRSYDSTYGTYKPGSWTAGQKYDFDVTAEVQQVVSRSGWCGGNALSLRVHDITGGVTSTRRAYSYDGALAAGNTGLAPKLVVTYSVDPKMTGSCMLIAFNNVPFYVGGDSQKFDDAEWIEGTTGTGSSQMTTGNTYLGFLSVPANNKRNQVGLRFPGITIDQGSTITNATLSMTAYASVSGMPQAEVSIYNVDDVPEWCTTTTSGSGWRSVTVTNCTIPATSTLVASTPTMNSSSPAGSSTAITKNKVFQYDVTSLVQGVINRPGWTNGNAMALLMRNNSPNKSSSNTAAAISQDGTSSTANIPVLLISGTKKITDLSQLVTARQELTNAVLAMSAGTSTPLGAAVAEAARYMLGLAPYNTGSGAYDSRTVTTTSPVKYDTPITADNACSSNTLFALTDGDPTVEANVISNTAGITGSSTCHSSIYNSVVKYSNTTEKDNWTCLMDLANTISSAGTNPRGVNIRVNPVIVGPLGGDADANMNLLAQYGKGTYYHAGDEKELVTALVQTVNDLLADNGSISAPGVAVNQLSRLSDLNELFFSVFDPTPNAAFWKGNVKRYQLSIDNNNNPSIIDVNGINAIDTTTGFFTSGSQSWWSIDVDGNKAALGGAANVLPAPDNRHGAGTARKIFTYVTSYPSMPVSSPVSLQAVNLGDSTFNTNAMAAMGITDTSIYTNLMHWLQGYVVTDIGDGLVSVDSTTPQQFVMGGALHSRPILVNYGYTGTDVAAAAADPDLQDNTVYFSTMEGVLHAINARTGVEQFAFIPKESLADLNTVANNPAQPLPEFGLDLTWTALRLDSNGDFKINAGDGDKVWLFGGQRMGGSNYYALDVTDRTTPKLKWVINGGPSSSVTAYQGMGQTWSQPTIGKVKINGTIKTVLFLGGGYDPKHEVAGFSSTTNASDSYGNQLYIVDADTGQLYWWASATGSPTMTVPAMKWSVPTQVKVLDANLDGLVDSVYFGDLGGQVFRLDLNNGNTGASGLGVRVQKFADLGQNITADTAHQRRFYEPPSIARLLDKSTNTAYMVVAMGSGYRSHPLDMATVDQFYVMRDNDALRKDLTTASTASLQATITPSSLAALDLTQTAGANLTGKQGFYVPLPDTGEKVLASPLIFNNEILATTYVPVSSANTCSVVPGRTKLYRMSVYDGSVSFDANGDGSLTSVDRITDNIITGMGADPQIAVLPGGKNAIIIGPSVTKNAQLQQGTLLRVRWYQKTH